MDRINEYIAGYEHDTVNIDRNIILHMFSDIICKDYVPSSSYEHKDDIIQNELLELSKMILMTGETITTFVYIIDDVHKFMYDIRVLNTEKYIKYLTENESIILFIHDKNENISYDEISECRGNVFKFKLVNIDGLIFNYFFKTKNFMKNIYNRVLTFIDDYNSFIHKVIEYDNLTYSRYTKKTIDRLATELRIMYNKFNVNHRYLDKQVVYNVFKGVAKNITPTAYISVGRKTWYMIVVIFYYELYLVNRLDDHSMLETCGIYDYR